MGKWISSGAVFVALLMTMVIAPVASADDRSDAAEAKRKADEQIAGLQTEVEGLSSDLAQVYTELGTVQANLPVAQSELAAAQEHLLVAEREYEQIRDQLTAAEAEKDRLETEIASAASEQEEISTAIGSMARDMYRGNTTTPLTLVMTSEGTGDITDRAASATTMARAQARTMDSVQESMVVMRNQAERQEAVTERISELEQAANDKLAEAETSRNELQEKVKGLETLQAELSAKQSAWDKKKSEAEKQLAQWESQRDEALSKIAAIDAENRANQVTFSEPSGGGVAPTSGALFSIPLPGGVVTSNYGWRMHPILGYNKLHDGVDFGAGCGQPQYAIGAGSVVASYYDSGGGNMVVINHGMMNGSSWTSEHLHLQSAAVSVGQSVDSSTVIGYTGTTGSSTGCHLHLTVTKDGATVDPLDYM